jgi:hypothetical protein
MVMERLLTIAEKMAKRDHDGHLTIMRFTTGWKAMFGTPDLTGGEGRQEIQDLFQHETLEEALYRLILDGLIGDKSKPR